MSSPRTLPGFSVRFTARAAALVAALVATLPIVGCTAEDPTRTEPRLTTSGRLVGERLPATADLPELEVYRGVRYAQPPVGELRWRPPRSYQAAPSAPPVDAREFGPRCPQPAAPDEPAELFSEDCLTLNLWTPAQSEDERLPVLIWIHGGAFRSGAGSLPIYDGARFAAEGAVFVTLNYRLGALGFLAHPELLAEETANRRGAAANFGLLDLQMAKAWVVGNIARFGGDPANVTVLGESAGGMAVQMLLTLPGCCEQAIAMSGYGTWPLPRVPSMIPEGAEVAAANPAANRAATPVVDATVLAEAIVARAREHAGLASDVPLREIPADSLVAAVEGLHTPIVDGTSLADEPATVFARGEQWPAPFLTGGNSYDGAVLQMAGMDEGAVFATWGDWQDELRTLYADDFERGEELGISRLFGDGRYLLAARRMARDMAAAGQPAWLYLWDWVPEEHRDAWPGAPHASELGALFGTAGLDGSRPDEATMAMGAELRRRFVAFARDRDPAGEGPAWPAIDPEGGSEPWLVFGPEPDTHVETGLLDERLDFFEERWRERLEAQGLVSPTRTAPFKN